MLEYDESIHQLKYWTQELMAYEFVSIHHPNKMMKDVDDVYRHIDTRIHHYLVNAVDMRSGDIRI